MSEKENKPVNPPKPPKGRIVNKPPNPSNPTQGRTAKGVNPKK